MNHAAGAMLSGCLLLATSATSQTKSAAWTTPSTEDVNAVYPEVESLYYDLHRTPELAMHEQQTAAKLAERVKALGYEVTTGVGGTGVVAVLRNGKGPTVLLRTDMDAFRSVKRRVCRLPVMSWLRAILERQSPSCMPAAMTSIPSADFWIGAVEPGKFAAAQQAGTDLPQLHSSTWAPNYTPTLKAAITVETTELLELLAR